jgi:GGDEF domain-containing protein
MTRAGDVPVTASFGSASTQKGGPDLSLKAELLLRAADECLYRSKQAGRNRTTAVEIAAAVAPPSSADLSANGAAI